MIILSVCRALKWLLRIFKLNIAIRILIIRIKLLLLHKFSLIYIYLLCEKSYRKRLTVRLS